MVLLGETMLDVILINWYWGLRLLNVTLNSGGCFFNGHVVIFLRLGSHVSIQRLGH